MRLLLPAAAVLAASLAQRRFGPAVGGRIVALPLTTGPFLLLLGLQSGTAATAHAASGVVVGELSVMAFCATYGLLASRRSLRRAYAWSVLTALGCAAFAVLASSMSMTLAAVAVVLTCFGFAAAQRDPATVPVAARTSPAWEVPARMALTSSIVGALLALSAVLGPATAGALATLPVIMSVMLPATHARDGALAAVALARSTLITLPATTVSVCVIGFGLVPLGVGVAVGLALVSLFAADWLAVGSMRSLDRYAGSRTQPLPA